MFWKRKIEKEKEKKGRGTPLENQAGAQPSLRPRASSSPGPLSAAHQDRPARAFPLPPLWPTAGPPPPLSLTFGPRASAPFLFLLQRDAETEPASLPHQFGNKPPISGFFAKSRATKPYKALSPPRIPLFASKSP